MTKNSSTKYEFGSKLEVEGKVPPFSIDKIISPKYLMAAMVEKEVTYIFTPVAGLQAYTIWGGRI